MIGRLDRKLLLAREMMEERALGDFGGRAQVVDGGGVVSLVPNDVQGNIEDPFPGARSLWRGRHVQLL
ncbi:MAG: hypothetical protein ABI330_19175 [Caldimonas sp.]